MLEIPLSRSYFPTSTLHKVRNVLLHDVQQGDGIESRNASDFISEKYGGTEALMVPSCTAALELSFMVLRVSQGDEVILPSYNFSSAAAATTKFWGTPVFCDIDYATGCIDVNHLESLISAKTKAITWVNYGGIAPDLRSVKKISQKYGIPLIEDAAHNFGVLTETQSELTGDFVTFSFHATKNLQCGEGGALVITNENYIDSAHISREKGTNRRDFQNGLAEKYRWVERGGSYLLSEISCAILVEQMNNLENIQTERQRIVVKYQDEIGRHLPEGWSVLEGTENSAHMFALLAPTPSIRNKVIYKLNCLGIGASSHYEDLSTSPAGVRYGKSPHECSNSIRFSRNIIRLPIFFGMTDSELSYIVDNTNTCLAKIE